MRLSVDRLACRRSGRLIFENLSFGLDAGEALAVTGRNGAGKSSLLSILAGRLRPDAGTVVADGTGEHDLSACLHLVGHRDGLKAALTAAENLAFAQRLLGGAAMAPLEALAALGMAGSGAIPVAYLSAGQRRRIALARLLVARRPLWLLDEPAASLDGAAEETLRAVIRRHLAEGGLVVAATHQPLGIPARGIRLGAAAGDGGGAP